jgi:hypothetical protein
LNKWKDQQKVQLPVTVMWHQEKKPHDMFEGDEDVAESTVEISIYCKSLQRKDIFRSCLRFPLPRVRTPAHLHSIVAETGNEALSLHMQVINSHQKKFDNLSLERAVQMLPNH